MYWSFVFHVLRWNIIKNYKNYYRKAEYDIYGKSGRKQKEKETCLAVAGILSVYE